MTASRKARETPLLFDPGTDWEYGSNIDRRTDIAGLWGTQILPFLDGPSVTGYQDLETAAYQALSGW